MITRKNLFGALLFVVVVGATGCSSGGTEEAGTAADADSIQATNDDTGNEGEAATSEMVQPLDNVSDEELEQFHEAAMAVQMYMQQVQPKMYAYVQEAGFEPRRYSQLIQAEQKGTKATPEVTPEEKARFDALRAKMETMQEAANDTMKIKIESAGLTPDHYQAIMATVRQDTTLQRKLNEMQVESMAAQKSPTP